MVRFLIEEIGANPSFEKCLRNSDGTRIMTPLLAAENQNKDKIADYLRHVISTGSGKRHKTPESEIFFDFTSSSELEVFDKLGGERGERGEREREGDGQEVTAMTSGGLVCIFSLLNC